MIKQETEAQPLLVSEYIKTTILRCLPSKFSETENVLLFTLLTLPIVAAILSVSNKTVSKWEISETYPDGALLVPIAKIFDAFGSITRHIR